MQARRWWIVLVLVASFGLSACGQSPAVPEGAVEGTTGNPREVMVSEEAAERLGIETTEVKQGKAGRTAVPYAAVLYDAEGETWVYTNPEPLVFVRTQITVNRIDGDVADLLDGPPSGTLVVTVGLAELFGAETGVGDPE
jgi:hypothetical protein